MNLDFNNIYFELIYKLKISIAEIKILLFFNIPDNFVLAKTDQNIRYNLILIRNISCA